MKFALLAALALTASAADIDGTWKAVFLGDPGTWPKTVGYIVFDLKAEGNQLTGIAEIGNWPGRTTISEGKIAGNRISFTAIGNSPWWSVSGDGTRRSGFPKLTFRGTVHDGQIEIDVAWDSIMINGEPGKPREHTMRATKLAGPCTRCLVDK